MIGRTLAHYQITAAIGVGGMGEVYRATDTKLGREVALKVLPADMARDPERLARFQREARAVAALNHPNIVTLYSVEEAGGVHFLTMELVEGQSLDHQILPGGLPVDRITAVATALADALAAAHEKGIVHRDLKPANVMLTPDGRVKVLDFGLAKAVEPARGGAGFSPPGSGRSGSNAPTLTSAGHTEAGMVMGTPAYMSPEQIKGGAVDHRTDIFSLGVLVYEMATGRRPFAAESSAELASAILRDAPPLVGDVRSDLPADLSRIVRRCLEKDPGRRAPHARDVGDDLRGMSRQPSSGGTVAESARAAPMVVVLPFVNRSADPENEYFSDGLTEEVIADLSGLEALRVISRNSAMALKGTTKDTPTIARELGATHIVSGSVRRVGDALRVTAELVEAATDTPVWSQKYSGTMADVFGIQEEIAQKIVAALKVKLTAVEERRAANRPIENVVAWDCYLRARQEMYWWTPQSLERATRLVDQALGIVGENPLLLATKGQIAWNLVNVMFDPDERHLDEADALARRALTLDPDDYMGLFVRGITAGMRGQSAHALRDTHRAHRLQPGDPNVLVEMCRFANAAGVDVDRYVNELVTIDPLTPVAWSVVAFNHFLSGRIDEAVPATRRVIELAPDVSMFHLFAASTFAMAGLRDEAIDLLDMAGRKLAGTLHGSWALFLRHALDGDADRASAHMTPLLERGASLQEHVARIIADGYALVGRHDDALRWIRLAMDRGFVNYPFLAVYDPLLANVRKDARFAPLMDEVKARWTALGAALPPPLRLVTPRSDVP